MCQRSASGRAGGVGGVGRGRGRARVLLKMLGTAVHSPPALAARGKFMAITITVDMASDSEGLRA